MVKKKVKVPPTPECDKLAAVYDESFVIGEFLEWLQHKKDVFLASDQEWTTEEPTFDSMDLEPGDPGYETTPIHRTAILPYNYTTEKLVAEFFNIDLKKVEKERRALLKTLQEANA